MGGSLSLYLPDIMFQIGSPTSEQAATEFSNSGFRTTTSLELKENPHQTHSQVSKCSWEMTFYTLEHSERKTV